MSDTGNRSEESLRRNWIITTATSVAIGLIVFVVAPIAANRLGPTGRGTLVTVQLLPQVLATLASAGLGFSIIHFGSQRRSSLRRLWRWSLGRCLLGSVAMFALGQLLAPVITSSADDERMLRTYLLLCPLVGFTSVPLEMLRAIGRFGAWNAFTFLNQVMWPAALLVGVLQSPPSLWLVVWLHLGASAMVLVLLVLYGLSVTASLRTEPVTDRTEYLRYGLKSALSTIPVSANAKLDQLVMAALVSTPNLGLYAAAVGWSQISQPVMRGLIAVTMPFVSGAHDSQQNQRVRRLTTVGAVTVLVLGAGGVMATLLLWGPLYGSEFRSALPAALFLVVAALLLQYNAMLGNVLRSLNRPGLVTWIESGVLVASTAALLVVLQVSEVLGPAVLSFATYLVAGVIYLVLIAARTDQSVPDLFDRHGMAVLAEEVRARLRNRGGT